MTTILIIMGWVIRLVMAPVVVVRIEHPMTCLAWLMIIFFEPWIGLVAYLLVGENKIGRKRLYKRSEAFGVYHQADPPSVDDQDQVLPAQFKEYEIVAALGDRLGGLPVVQGNRVTVIPDSEEVIDRLLSDVARAERHVHLLFYIFEDDDTGGRVGEALAEAAGRGVECRVLADAAGSRPLFRRLAGRLERRGVEIFPMLPANFWRRRVARLDIRNHRKLAVIDGRIAYAGSQNIVNPGYGPKKKGRWVDIMARVVGPAVRQFQTIFLEDWFYASDRLITASAYFPEPEKAGRASLQVVPTGPDCPTEHFQHLLVEAIYKARRQVVITTPYFIPDEGLLMALRLAALRGVTVDVIAPRRSDSRIVDAAGEFYWRHLLAHGVNIYLHQTGLLHAKTLTVDDKFGMMGSANYDRRSFYLNFELNLLLFNRDAIWDLRRVQDQYRRQSRPASREDAADMKPSRRVMINLAKLLSPLL